MYSIAGYVGLQRGVADETVLRRMARQLAPVGQDGEGLVVHGPIGLVQRGPTAPVTRPPYVMAYDGEIYNRRELREELAGLGHPCGGDSDAEVVLAAWRQWGAAALDRCNGRFALAILDLTNGDVTLARDPIGGPSLYYVADGTGRVAFASDLRAVVAAGMVPRRPDDATIYRYLSTGVHDDTERTFVDRVIRVMPGERVTIPAAGQPRRETCTRLYRELDLLATTRRPNTATAREQVGEVLAEAVQRRRAAEPVAGAHPSGPEPMPYRPIEDLLGFVANQQEPVGTLAAYADYRQVRAHGRQAGMLVGRSGAGDLIAEHLRELSQPVSHRLRRRPTIPAVSAAPLLAAEFVMAHRDLTVHPRSTEDLFRRRLPAVLRYQDRNGARFAVQRRDPYLDPHLLRVLWSLDPAVLREVAGDPAPVRRIPDGWPAPLSPVAEELFGSESFGARPYVDRSAVLTSYRTSGIDPGLCWRLVNLELWLREFVDRDPTFPPASTFVAFYPKSTPVVTPGPPAPPADDDTLITVDAGA
jgi:asparagine synthase (glutamine-hydrolysing)